MWIMVYPAGGIRRLRKVENSVKALQETLGGPMTPVRLSENLLLLARADQGGEVKNRVVHSEFGGRRVICGDFLVCQRDREDRLFGLSQPDIDELARYVEEPHG